MLAFAFRRLLWTLPTLFGVTLVCFALLQLAGGDPIASGEELLGTGARVSGEAVRRLREIYGLDQPWYIQYARLVRRFVTLDFGHRWQDGRPIAEVLGEALPVTLLLSLSSLLLSYLIAIPVGVYSAVREHTRLDQALTFALFVLYSLPSYWLGTMALVFLASGQHVDCSMFGAVGCFPLHGWRTEGVFAELDIPHKVLDVLWHLVLPVVTLTYGGLASLSRYMRSAMLEALRSDYIRTARAKGLSERAIVFGHALRNSLLPIVTLFGLSLPQLLSGSVLVESIFGIRGLGLVTLEAIRLPDYPMVITSVGLAGLFTACGVFLSDVLYALIDPRIQQGGDGRGG